MADLTANETDWIKVTARALLAIRVATHAQPDADQVRDIHQLADALHNIGMVGTGNSMFQTLHTPEDLAEVQTVADRLLHSIHRVTPSGRSPIEKLFGLKH